MKKYVILVAGGSGSRMKSEIPKQFLSFGGKAVLSHTIDRFYHFDKEIKIIVVLPESSLSYWDDLVIANPPPCPITIAKGGNTRSDSSRSGLSLVPKDVLVAIHDAVRPMLSTALIKRCFDVAEKHGNACPGIIPVDSLRKKENDLSIAVNRSEYFQVQTPQCFQSSLIKAAFEKTVDNSFTDETSLFEKAGHKIHLVEGDRWNIKITFPEDLLVAEALSSKIY